MALLTCDNGDAILISVRQRSVPTVTAMLAAVVLALSYPSLAQTQEAWFGTWNLQLFNSAQADSTPYKRVTTRIEPLQDGLKVTYDMVGIRGGVTHMEWNGKFDGKDYPMQGVDYVMTNAYRRIDDRNYEIVIKRDGTLSAIARVEVSPDGKTLRVTTEQKASRGTSSSTTAVYERR